MKLPKEFLIDATIDRLGPKFQKTYEKWNNEDVRDFLRRLFTEELIESDSERQKNIKEVKSNFYKNRFKKTKKNWFQGLKKGLEKHKGTRKELAHEIDFIQKGVKDGYISLEEKGVSSVEELIEKRLQEVEEWVKDDTKLLIDYKYFDHKTPVQISKALATDAILATTQLIIDQYQGEVSTIVKEVNDVFTQFPFPGRDTEDKFEVVHDQPSVAIDTYSDGMVEITTKMRVDPFDPKQSLSVSKTDLAIFNYVLSKRDIDFVHDRKIFLNVGDIVKHVYSSRSLKSYSQVRQRLLKLKNLSFFIQDDNQDAYFFDLFDMLVFKDNKREVEIQINEFMYRNVLDAHVTKIYSDKIKNFKINISESMVFILQKERFSKNFNQVDDQSSRFFVYSYEFFTRRIRFKSKNKEANMKKVEDALREIVDSQVTVKSFKKQNGMFHISFLPVTNYEAEDLIETAHNRNMLTVVE